MTVNNDFGIPSLQILDPAYKLLKISDSFLDNMKKNRCHTTGYRLVELSYQIIDLILDANGSIDDLPKRVSLIDDLKNAVYKVRLTIRFLNETTKTISLKDINRVSELLDEIWQQADSWRKYTKKQLQKK